jgi:VWFA-related protein
VKFRIVVCGLIAIFAPPAVISAYTQAGNANEPTSPLRVESTLVWVPALVKDESGTALEHVHINGLRLFDSGNPEKMSKIDTAGLPISLVILMQTGGSANRFLPAYSALSSLLGDSVQEITLVTFDSRVEQIWHFPARTDGVDFALTHQQPGDKGAAIKDAVSFGVRQLQAEPGRFRRIVLLLSQRSDSGSSTSSQSLLEQLGTSSTVVYSLTFPIEDAHVGRKHKDREKGSICGTLAATNQAIEGQTAEEASTLTGGSSFQFKNDREFNAAMLEVLSDVRNGITLGFQPSRHEVGLHCIEVKADSRKLRVSARRAYWRASPE